MPSKPKKIHPKNCLKCGQEYLVIKARLNKAMFCSPKCHNSYTAGLPTKKCAGCKEVKNKTEFYPKKTRAGLDTAYSYCKVCAPLRMKDFFHKKRAARPKVIIEDLPGEIWVPVKGYEEKYRVSNMGRVKSLDRLSYRKAMGGNVLMEGKLLAQSSDRDNRYPMVSVYGGNPEAKISIRVYYLVFFSFNPDLEKIPGYEIDHKDQNRLNSRLDNLQYIPQRDNILKMHIHNKNNSDLPGTYWSKRKRKWETALSSKGERYYLGTYKTEKEASDIYLDAVAALESGNIKEWYSNFKAKGQQTFCYQ